MFPVTFPHDIAQSRIIQVQGILDMQNPIRSRQFDLTISLIAISRRPIESGRGQLAGPIVVVLDEVVDRDSLHQLLPESSEMRSNPVILNQPILAGPNPQIIGQVAVLEPPTRHIVIEIARIHIPHLGIPIHRIDNLQSLRAQQAIIAVDNNDHTVGRTVPLGPEEHVCQGAHPLKIVNYCHTGCQVGVLGGVEVFEDVVGGGVGGVVVDVQDVIVGVVLPPD